MLNAPVLSGFAPVFFYKENVLTIFVSAISNKIFAAVRMIFRNIVITLLFT